MERKIIKRIDGIIQIYCMVQHQIGQNCTGEHFGNGTDFKGILMILNWKNGVVSFLHTVELYPAILNKGESELGVVRKDFSMVKNQLGLGFCNSLLVNSLMIDGCFGVRITTTE